MKIFKDTITVIISSFLLVVITLYLKNKVSTKYPVNTSQVLKFLPDFEIPNFPESKIVNKQSVMDKSKKGFYFFHFWATWCAPCETEFPSLLDYIKKLNNKNIKSYFYLVAVNDDLTKIKKFLKTYKLPENVFVLIDNDGSVAKSFGTYKLPETFVFNTIKDKIIEKFVGPQEWHLDYFLNVLNKPVD